MELVVDNAQFLDLLRRQVLCADDRHLRQSQLVSRLDPGVATNHNAVLVGHHGHQEAIGVDGFGHRTDRRLVVSRVAIVLLEPLDGPHFDLHVHAHP